jgi:Peptidase family S41
VGNDVRLLARELERLHPNPWHDLSPLEWADAVERLAASFDGLEPDGQLVELMRLTALLGDRDGHTGLDPFADHRHPLHLVPLQLYDFAGGLYVVDSLADTALVGKRLAGIGHIPVELVVEAVRPLVGRDNDWTLRARLVEAVLVCEVLGGLGLAAAGRLQVAFADGTEATLAPMPVSEWRQRVARPLPRRPELRYAARSDRDWWIERTGDGNVVAAYNRTYSYPDFAARLRDLVAEPRFRRLVLDLRLNGGGDNTQYGELLGLLRSEPLNRRGRLLVLAGRHTFSAAGSLAADLRRRTRAIFVGEPTGGAPNQYGDSAIVTLPHSGWNVRVATLYHEFGGPDDPRLAVEPDVHVELSAADFLAGRDPVLDAALTW